MLPRRWVVERTFAWLGRSRRLARDYERKPEHAEAMIKIAMIRLMPPGWPGRTTSPKGRSSAKPPADSPSKTSTISPTNPHSKFRNTHLGRDQAMRVGERRVCDLQGD